MKRIIPIVLAALALVSCAGPKTSEKKTVILTMGTRDATFWQHFYAGAVAEADELGVDLEAFWCENDTDWMSFADAIEHSDTVSNLVGIVGSISREGMDKACAYIPDGVNLILMEGSFFPGGFSEKRANGEVKLDVQEYVKALLDSIPPVNILVYSYNSGNNLNLANEIVRQRGDDVTSVLVADLSQVAEDLKAKADELHLYDAVILNSTAFVYTEVFDLIGDKAVYVSDMDREAAEYIRTGQVKLDISADTYAFGALCIDAAVDGQSRTVPFILTDINNIDSPSRGKFL